VPETATAFSPLALIVGAYFERRARSWFLPEGSSPVRATLVLTKLNFVIKKKEFLLSVVPSHFFTSLPGRMPMDQSGLQTRVETYLLGLLERSETLSRTVQSRGWGYVLTWGHRIAGVLLVLYMLFHVFTLSALRDPGAFASKMALFDNVLFSFLEWTLAIPVIFHGLNGTRLILYEAFRVRQDEVMIRWVLLLSGIYVFTLALFMLMGSQEVTAGLFWLPVVITSALLSIVVYQRVWETKNSRLWKLQRVSGAVLLPLASGHMLFMHLNYRTGHDVNVILERLSSPGVRALDLVFVAAVFFHAGFGLSTIVGDYVEDRLVRRGLTVLLSFILAAFAYSGIKLALTL
jgi:succinate dehydrogenase hydrophobic membrane anchor protein